MKNLLTLVILLFPALYGWADEENTVKKTTDAHITGHVILKETGEHLPFMTILLKGTNIGTATDETGHFFLKNLPEGKYTLRVQGVGYKSAEKEIVIVRGKTQEVNFEISEDAVMLDGAVVSANRNETDRREAPVIVNVLSPKVFENTNSVCLSQGLNFQPGLRVENNCQNCGFQQVRINGLDLYARRSAREAAALHHSLSVVFQDYTSSANPRFRVEHIIGESLRALERSTGQRVDRRARICELLEQVGLPAAFISRYPHELSGGQLQRVCIARALAIRPRIILLDEAISSLDASTQVQIMDLLIELRRDLGLSYLFITHDLTSITYLCDRVVFIDAGTIVEQVDDIRCIAMIRSDYARNLLGSVMGIGVEHGSGAARTGQDRYAAIA